LLFCVSLKTDTSTNNCPLAGHLTTIVAYVYEREVRPLG
jgi:hypothetical protein